jgi:hypothetical protein
MDVEMTKKVAFDYDTVMFEQTKDGRGMGNGIGLMASRSKG